MTAGRFITPEQAQDLFGDPALGTVRPLTYKSTKACKQCPFLKGHGAPGYTGPYESGLELHRDGMEREYPCHTRTPQQCVGAQVHRKKNCKGMHDFSVATQEHQKAVLAERPEYLELAMYLPDFIEHHIKPWLKRSDTSTKSS